MLAGPWACQLLGDLGADVLKVERPVMGDDTRHWGPPWLPDGEGRPTDQSAYFAAANRNKRSLTLDLSTSLGRDVVRRLAQHCDVVVDNFKVGTLQRWGLDGPSLRADNPGLITCSVTGFGQTGSARARPGYDLLIQAMGGLMSITGDADGPATKVGVAVADLMTGMYASNAILAALLHRARTGVGQDVDLSLHDSQLAMLANQAMNYLASGVSPHRRGNAHPNLVPYQPFPTADGDLVVAVGNDRQFASLAKVVGHPEWIERFPTSADRVEQREALVPLLEAALATRSRVDWQTRLEVAGVPAGPVHTVQEAFEGPLATERGSVVSQPHPTAGVVRTVANPIRLSETPVNYRYAPPLCGQHTVEVLTEILSMSAEEIDALRAAGVFGKM